MPLIVRRALSAAMQIAAMRTVADGQGYRPVSPIHRIARIA
jgi:hypothetical protein